MQLEVHQEVPSAVREVIELTDYAVQMRYPGDYYPVSDEEYERAVELASRTLDWVSDQIGKLDAIED
jgi:HEPN domain-containing protein